jgi:hypothetical protein
MAEERTAWPDASRLRRHVRAVAAVIIAAIVVSLELVWVSDPARLAPHELDLWGHAFTADGDAYVLETLQDPPWPNEPISLAEVLRRDPNPVIVRQTSGPLLIGLTSCRCRNRPPRRRRGRLPAGRIGRVHPLLLGQQLLRADMVS